MTGRGTQGGKGVVRLRFQRAARLVDQARAAEMPLAAPPAKPPVWNDPRYRALFFQALVLGGVIAAGVFLVNNTLANLERQGIASGFGFLSKTAGFSIGESLIGYAEENSYGRAMVVGLLNTILVSALGIFFATIIGFVVGVLRLSKNWLVNKLAMIYIESCRSRSSMTLRVGVGTQLPIFPTSIGRAFLAGLPASERMYLVHELSQRDPVAWAVQRPIWPMWPAGGWRGTGNCSFSPGICWPVS